MTCCTRSRGKRRRWWPRWPFCPPVLRPVRFLTTGGGAAGGLAEGGSDELEALAPRRAWRSRTWASRSATRWCSAARAASRWAHPGQLGSLIPSLYQNGCPPASPVGPGPRARRAGRQLEPVGRVGPGRVERPRVSRQQLRQPQVVPPDTLDDTPGQLVGPVVAVVRAVARLEQGGGPLGPQGLVE